MGYKAHVTNAMEPYQRALTELSKRLEQYLDKPFAISIVGSVRKGTAVFPESDLDGIVAVNGEISNEDKARIQRDIVSSCESNGVTSDVLYSAFSIPQIKERIEKDHPLDFGLIYTRVLRFLYGEVVYSNFDHQAAQLDLERTILDYEGEPTIKLMREKAENSRR